MAIRFQCSACRRKLSIGDHKAGKQVRCPQCQAVLTVPTSDELAATAIMAGEAAPSEEPPVEFAFAGLESPVASDAFAAPPVAAQAPTQEFNPEVVAVTRRALYAQGVLIALVGLIAFVLGFVLGGGGGGGGVARGPDVPQGPFRVAGRLTYTAGGASQGDGGAVVIVLPQGGSPDEKIPIDGLRPQDPPPDPEAIALRAIESLGGQYVRSGASGEFQFHVPNAGKYHVLFLSNATQRPSNKQPRPEDLAVLGRYFQLAPDLLESRKYLWNTVEIAADGDLAYDFGVSGR